MEELYRVDMGTSGRMVRSGEINYGASSSDRQCLHIRSSAEEDSMLQFQAAHVHGGSRMSDLVKTQIATHPRYPHLLSAYIECQKVGAPPEMASVLEEINRDSQYHYPISSSCSNIELGADPELDQFMESYCEVLHRYKEELAKPFDEATSFLSSIESELSNLCQGLTLPKSLDYRSDEGGGSSEEEQSVGEIELGAADQSYQESSDKLLNDQDIKGMLLRKYSGYLSSLRKEFLKKRKKGKLPKDARTTLLDWWNNHYRWPYPTEDEKLKLSKTTGLDQKQINNWFINQRKRHWKPSEDMRYALMEGVNTGTGMAGALPIYFDTEGAGENGNQS